MATKDIYTEAREWHIANEARPISETVRQLEATWNLAGNAADKAYQTYKITRKIRDERVVDNANIAQICHEIDATKDALLELIAKLDDASASLANAAEVA